MMLDSTLQLGTAASLCIASARLSQSHYQSVLPVVRKLCSPRCSATEFE
jgi:hypothetical protein